MDAYRTPAFVEPEPLPSTCVPPPVTKACRYHTLRTGVGKALGAASALGLFLVAATFGAVVHVMIAAQRHAALVQQQAQYATPPQPRSPAACAPTHATPPPAPPPAASQGTGHAPPKGTPSVLASFGPETHEADELWRRGEELRSYGISSFTMSAAWMPLRELSAVALEHDYLRVGRGLGGDQGGITLFRVDPASPAAKVGLRNGDRVRAINGYVVRSPEDVLLAYASIEEQHAVLLELVRGEKRVVLRVDFGSFGR